MDEDRRGVCAWGSVGGTGRTAAGPCPGAEGKGRERSREETRRGFLSF